MNTEPVMDTSKNVVVNKLTPEQWNELLEEHTVTVSFVKADGTTRVMMASRQKGIIAEAESRRSGSTMSTISWPEYQIRCIDVTLMEWRSFVADRVISYTIED